MLREGHDDSFPIIDVGGSVSGISAAGVGFGMPGIINFNQAKYNLSTGGLFKLIGYKTHTHALTGGLLPAIKSFTGSQTPPGANGTRMQFSGGITLVNYTIGGHGSSGSRDWLAIQRNFSVHQQGITADIHCQRADASSQVLNFTSVSYHAHRNLTWEYVSGVYSGCMEFDSELQHQYVYFLLDMICLDSLDVPR
jgi:hypothetical protein